jgi:hypothetical protein
LELGQRIGVVERDGLIDGLGGEWKERGGEDKQWAHDGN